MNNLKFPFRWVGVYEYDNIPEFDLTPEPVAFKLEFCFASDTDFTGQVCDDVNSSMPEPGTISGKLVGNKIEFVKQMPPTWSWMDHHESLIVLIPTFTMLASSFLMKT